VDVDAIGCGASRAARSSCVGRVGFLYVSDRALAAGAHPLFVDAGAT
jgi:hypothetical protein